MKYLQYKPIDPRISPFVDYYNSLICDKNGGQSYISIPEGRIGIVFILNGSETISTRNEIFVKKEAHVHGLSKIKTVVDLSANLHTFSIIFKPTGLYHFLPSIPIDTLVKSYVDIEDIFGKEIHRTIDHLKECHTDKERIRVLEEFLIYHQRESDLRFESAVQMIIQAKGEIKVKTLVDLIHISERQLYNVFKQKLGLSPKDFIKLTRFKNVLDSFPSPGKTMASHACEFGYYDESHFIHEFKQFTDLSPKKFFKNQQITSDFYNFRRILLQ